MGNNNILCILGMHRSGTSVISNWLQSCGLSIGDRLLKSDFSNENGHFEDLDFLELHKQILLSNNFEETGLKKLTDVQINKYFHHKIDSLIKFKNTLHLEWGWKEPRTCLFAEEYLKRIPHLKFLVIYRSGNQVINSLLSRDVKRYLQQQESSGLLNTLKIVFFKRYLINRLLMKNGPEYVKSYQFYIKRLIVFLEKLNPSQYLITSVEDLNANANPVFNQLTKKWGFNLTYHSFNMIFNPNLIDIKNKHTYVDKIVTDLDSIKNLDKKLLAFVKR